MEEALRRRKVGHRPAAGAVDTTWLRRGAHEYDLLRAAQGSPDNQADAFDADPRMQRDRRRAHGRGGRTMMTWHMLRAAAIARHRIVWKACGSDPFTWELHMSMIRAVYGY
jgi:hypothetical protein